MANKRKYHFVFADNTKEEELEARKNFTLMLTRTIFKKGIWIIEFIYFIWILILWYIIYLNWKAWLFLIVFQLIIILFIILKSKLWKK